MFPRKVKKKTQNIWIKVPKYQAVADKSSLLETKTVLEKLSKLSMSKHWKFLNLYNKAETV